jgi:hypothetical protein
MAMVEQEMLLLATSAVLVGTNSNALVKQATQEIENDTLTDATLVKLKALARPRIMTVWFNAWWVVSRAMSALWMLGNHN